MIVPINKRWRVNIDSMDFTLQKLVVGERKSDGEDKETGERWSKGDRFERWENRGHWGSLEQALSHYPDARMKESDAEGLRAVKALLTECRDEIRALAKAIRPTG